MIAVVLAHQGGWDEILMVAMPIALFAGLLFVANRRANDQQRAAAPPDPPDEDEIRGD